MYFYGAIFVKKTVATAMLKSKIIEYKKYIIKKCNYTSVDLIRKI